MNLFNRRELMTVFSMRQLYALQDALNAEGISYHTKTVLSAGRMGGRGRGSPFQDFDAAYTFKLYVHRDDYDRAVMAIQPALRG